MGEYGPPYSMDMAHTALDPSWVRELGAERSRSGHTATDASKEAE